MTLQGEDLFIAGLGEPWRSDTIDLIRKQMQHVDALFAVSEQYSRFMMSYLAIPAAKMHVLPLGVNIDSLRSDAPPTVEPERGTAGRLFRPHRAGEGPARVCARRTAASENERTWGR